MSEANQPSGKGFTNLKAMGAILLAMILYVALAVAAIETFYRGSPVKWLVGIVVAVYLGGSFALWWRGHPLWQRFGWATKAWASVFVLVGLLALTVWLPGGISNGLTLFTLSTSTLLSLVTATASVFSGIILFQLKYPHPAVKWAAAVLTAYGVVAFLWGAYSGTSFPALLSGQSFWSWLPRVLQGAFIGALVIVPGALIYNVVGVLQRSRAIEFKSWGQPLLGLAMSLVMVVAGLTTSIGFARHQMQFSNPVSGARVGPIFFARGESGNQPVGRADRFKEGNKAVYAFFDLEGLKPNDTVSVVWYKGGDQLSEQSANVSELPGAIPNKKSHIWVITKFENGAPPGGYFVEIGVNGTLALAGSFAVDPK
jgi:hypothetical protein